jgi:N-acylneuraminate cytidylyltransferase
MSIAVIPARGGSKRIPKKNIKLFRGEPIIARSIQVAINSGLFDEVIVSTDDKEIAKISINFGASVPFFRPHELSNDHATTLDAMEHAARWLRANNKLSESLCCIYPTAPFLEQTDLSQAFKLLNKSTHYVFSAVEYNHPVQRAFSLNEQLGVQMNQPNHIQTRSQDLEPNYHDAGMFYLGWAESFINQQPIFSEHSKALVLPNYRVHDIDNTDDWYRAELMHQAYLSQE